MALVTSIIDYFIQNLQTAVVAAAEAIDLYQPISRISVFINHSWVKA